jgi:uncharacterized protein (TIGR02596 family)
MKTFTRFPSLKGSPAFSLLELLLVLAVIAVLAALASEGFSTAVQGAAITTSADMINNLFVEGRAAAIAQNTEVEVRIYELASASSLPPSYTALQLHWIKPDGTTPPVSKSLLLPSWVAIDATSAHSTLIAANPETATTDPTDTRLDANTRVFHFMPDGSTDLPPALNWFLTIRAATQSDAAHFPTNWACVSIDPTTGRSQIYRP